MCLGVFLGATSDASGTTYKRLGVGQMSWTYIRKGLDKQERESGMRHPRETSTSSRVNATSQPSWHFQDSADGYFTENKLTTITLV